MQEKILEEINTLLLEKDSAKLKETLAGENPVDIAEIFCHLDEKIVPRLYRLLPKSLAAEVFIEMPSDLKEALIASFADREITETMSELFYDDAADLIEELPAGVVKRILANTPQKDRAEINKLLKFEEDTAGSIMTTEFVNLRTDMTVGAALDYIRAVAPDKETVYTCYVISADRKLLGLVTALTLLTADVGKTIGELMETNVIFATTATDKEEVAALIRKYDFLALPIVDSEERLVGIVTVDDAVDVMQEEAEEDFAKMAAITPSETPYLKTSPFSIYKTRIPWLLLLMISATFTSMIISSFENALAAQVILTMFIPMLMDTGGNCGSQASVTVIRALSLGEVGWKDVLRVLAKEVAVAALCGLTLSVVAFIKLMTVDNFLSGGIAPLVAFTVAMTLLCTVIVAKLIGAFLPIAARKIGLDPAVVASPMITTLVDAMSLLVYFSLAKALLGL
ncbi:MAG: magnesium transporter [Clostridia bacterium]|nr:magnesium transporter [Clostridia bacterium]